VIPKGQWIALSHRMIQHGRRYCTARRPKCDECPLASICPRIGVDTT
jgi:endonuclease-3